MKTIYLALYVLLLSFSVSYSDSIPPAFCGDLNTQIVGVNNTYTITCIVELASIPFEGSNEPNTCVSTNRVGEFQNGSISREFELISGNCVPYDAPIAYHKTITPWNITNPIDLASPIEPDHCNGTWGFGKYKITFLISPTGETYTFYFNNLDNHYGKTNWNGRYRYSNDWTFQYNGALTLGSRVEIRGLTNAANDTTYAIVSTTDTSNGLPTREFKVWELLYGVSQPYNRTFYARTTPFGISPQYIDSGYTRNLVLGTTVIMDSVYNNGGNGDKFGFNTVDTNGGGGGGQLSYHYYYSHPPIDPSDNDKGNVYTTPAWVYSDGTIYDYGTKITAASGDTLWLKQSKVLWVTGIRDILNPTGQFYGDTLVFKSGSTLRLDPSAEIEMTRAGVLIYETGSNVIWNQHTCNSVDEFSKLVVRGGGTFVVKDGGFMQINDGGKLIVEDNTTLSFESSTSPLILNSGSEVVLGNNAKIEFKNGAHLRANGCTFSSTGTWQGIELENSTFDTIQNCTFSDASTYLDFQQHDTSSHHVKKIVGNTFNNGEVRLGNVRNVLIQNNIFNGNNSYTGDLLEINNNITFTTGVFSLNILTNTFKSGNVQLKLNNFNAISRFYIYGNHFEGDNTNGRIGIFTNNSSGDIKMNTFEDEYFTKAMYIKSSNFNILSNTIWSSGDDNIDIDVSSTATLAPMEPSFVSATSLFWFGGKNQLDLDYTGSTLTANCRFSLGSVLNIDKGQNCFNRYNISANYHIIGSYECPDGPPLVLMGRENSWNTTPPKDTLECATLNYSNPMGSGCTATLPGGEVYDVVDMGGGVYDTLYSADGEGGDGDGGSVSSEQEEANLFTEALLSKRSKNYISAIEKTQEIIDNFENGKYLLQSLDELYLANHLSDSGSNTNTLFTSLKNYLEEKMEQYDSNSAFIDRAYKYYLLSLVKLGDYTDAISGYENIMNNHPDPVVQLSASWDRAAVILLMNGQGGGFSEVKTKKPSDKNPDKIARKMFKLATKNAEQKSDSKIEKYSKEEKKIISERAGKFNPSNQKEFRNKVDADLSMLLGLGNKSGNFNATVTPIKYNLHQNYPNPFNPVTTIKYDIPKDGFITLKIYDILGREVFKLDEFKAVGTHEIKFDGSNYASGMYFYQLKAGNYKETKKMVLVK